MPTAKTTTLRTTSGDDHQLHLVLTDERTGELIDFEVLRAPFGPEVVQDAMDRLRSRLQDPSAAEANETVMPAADDVAVGSDAPTAAPASAAPNVVPEPSPERLRIEQARRQAMIARLAPIAHLYGASPYRAAGAGRGERS